MRKLINETLNYCGYEGERTEAAVIECFLDYVDCGVFGNLDVEEATDLIEEGEITITQMCRNLLRA
jgi:hypothetical protein